MHCLYRFIDTQPFGTGVLNVGDIISTVNNLYRLYTNMLASVRLESEVIKRVRRVRSASE